MPLHPPCICMYRSYKQAPFFILDEIDAALDNVNVKKVSSIYAYLPSMSITHHVLCVSSRFATTSDKDPAISSVCSSLTKSSSWRRPTRWWACARAAWAATGACRPLASCPSTFDPSSPSRGVRAMATGWMKKRGGESWELPVEMLITRYMVATRR